MVRDRLTKEIEQMREFFLLDGNQQAGCAGFGRITRNSECVSLEFICAAPSGD
jgi:hypothetical protein